VRSQLYVAITRAMCDLVWYEGDEARMAPMRELLAHFALVEERAMDEDLTRQLLRSSSPEEWRAKGRQLFTQGQYARARQCFVRSGDRDLAMWAAACDKQEQAGAARARGGSEADGLFAEAAELFLAAGQAPQAAECYEAGRRWADAARIHCERRSPPDWRAAARCHELAGAWGAAAGAHERCALALGGGAAAGDAPAASMGSEARDLQAAAGQLLHVERALACCLEGGDSSCYDRGLQMLDELLAGAGASHGGSDSGGGGGGGDGAGLSLDGALQGADGGASGSGAAAGPGAAAQAAGADGGRIADGTRPPPMPLPPAAAAAAAFGAAPSSGLGRRLAELRQLYLYLGALAWHARGERRRMLDWLLRLDSTARQRRFLSSRGYLDELVDVEEAAGNYWAAAQASAKGVGRTTADRGMLIDRARPAPASAVVSVVDFYALYPCPADKACGTACRA
jgi:hypothetical protein